MEIKKQVINAFLENLYILSDKAYQNRVWIEGRGSEVHSFDDAVNDFFDLGEDIFNNYSKYQLTKPQQNLLDRFRREFETFTNDKKNHYHPYQFIDSPEWKEMIEKAKEVLKTFNYQKPVNSD